MTVSHLISFYCDFKDNGKGLVQLCSAFIKSHFKRCHAAMICGIRMEKFARKFASKVIKKG
jgi:hypothetical protein